MNSFIEYIIQGIVQGLTEFLPVSSSGHLSLTQHFLGITGEGAVLGTILLHLGTLAAVFIAFHKTIWGLIKEFVFLIRDVFTGKFQWKTMSSMRRMVIMILLSTIATLVVMLLPLPAVSGMAEKDVLFQLGGVRFAMLKDIFTHLSSDAGIMAEGFSFLYIGCLLILSSRVKVRQKDAGDVTVKNALFIGAAQGVAGMPGVSRSGSTISAGLLCGLPKEYVVQYSFILGIPAILGANLLEVGDAVKEDVALDLAPMLVGVLVSAVVGLLAIKMLQWLLNNDKFHLFGYYCLILGAATIICALVEMAAGQTIPQMLA